MHNNMGKRQTVSVGRLVKPNITHSKSKTKRISRPGFGQASRHSVKRKSISIKKVDVREQRPTNY